MLTVAVGIDKKYPSTVYAYIECQLTFYHGAMQGLFTDIVKSSKQTKNV